MCKKEIINKKVIFAYKKRLRERGIQVMGDLTQRRLVWIHTFLTLYVFCPGSSPPPLHKCQDEADVVPCTGFCETVTMLANVRSKRCGRSRLYRRNKRVGSQRVAMYNTFCSEQHPLAGISQGVMQGVNP